MNRPAGAAAIARPADADDPKPRGDMIEHLADRLADQVQRTAAAGASLMLDIEPNILAGQVCRQAWLFVWSALRGPVPACRKPGLRPRQIGGEVLKSEL